MPFIDANGLKFHYQELGSGPVTVMLHEFLANLTSCYLTAAQLARTGRRVVLVDLRGHGKTERSAQGYDLRTLGRDLGGWLGELAPDEPVDLAGLSYGGLVALHHALERPGSVRRLVLVESPLPPARREDFTEMLEARTESVVAGLPEAVRKAALANPLVAARVSRRARYLARETSLIDDVCAEAPLADAALATFQVPTLLVYGTDSRLVGVGERLSRTLGNSRLRTLDGGHWLHAERPAELAAEIGRFLDG